MITVQHFEQINRTPALPIAVEGHNAMLQAGMSDPVTAINWDNEALLAKDDAAAVGVLVFCHHKWDCSLFVNIGYVQPSARRQGAYRAMWERLVEIARERKVSVIIGASHVDNAEIRLVNERLGRKPYAIMYAYPVPEC